MSHTHFEPLQCPIPLHDYPHVLMAHGNGGRLMHQLIERMFRPAFGDHPDWNHDAARLALPHGQVAFTTDSYVVSPLFFPGGDIGSMAVYGTVNDLSMSGARPLYLSLSFILEEGLPMDLLWQVVQSIQAAAAQANVQVVTGDTKVVDRSNGDGLYINTAGIGSIEHPWHIQAQSVQPHDAILLSGDIGRHGIAIMAQRAGLEFETPLTSDLAPVVAPVQALLQAGIELHCLRDLTRGGLAIALNEIAMLAQHTLQLDANIPITPAVQGACELLGLDPLYLANEGRFIAFVPDTDAAQALAILQQHTPDAQSLPAQHIGTVMPGGATAVSGGVQQYTAIGSNRILDYRTADLLPRIC